MIDRRSRNVAMMTHFTGSVAGFFFPTFGWVGPAIMWAINTKDQDVVEHAREAFKFQFAMSLIAWTLGIVGAGLSCFLFGPVFWILGLVPWVAGMAGGVMAGFATNNEERFTYPVTGSPLVIR